MYLVLVLADYHPQVPRVAEPGKGEVQLPSRESSDPCLFRLRLDLLYYGLLYIIPLCDYEMKSLYVLYTM